jgi:hypothetical protein
MATKAQAFRTQQARAAHPPKPKQTERPRRDRLVDTSLPGVSATDRKAVRGRNRNLLAGRRGGATLEGSLGRPPRKSTRKSSDRTKRTTNQQLQAVRETTAPSARTARGQAATDSARSKTRSQAKTQARTRAKTQAKTRAKPRGR